jgi:hypothetical protein
MYVFLASSAYSGSTLLSFLLGTHPRIATVSAASGGRRQAQIDTYRCSCGRLMTECPFWLAVQEAMRARGYADFRLDHFELGFDRRPGSRLERLRTGSLRWTRAEDVRDAAFAHFGGHGAAMAATGRRNADFASVVMELTGATAFVDASKERMRIRHLARHLPMPLRVIHLVRDVRGVATSARHHGAGSLADVDAAARNWSATNRTILRHVARLPGEAHTTVRYEDLCRDPKAVMAELFAFIGVDPDAAATEVSGGIEQHLLGNRRRLEAWTEIRLDERWRTELAAADQDRVVAIGGGVLRSLYPG